MSQMQPWMATRAGLMNGGMGFVHPYTYILEGITMGYFDKRGLPKKPGWLENEKARGNCPYE